MAAALDGEGERGVDDRPRPVARDREFGQRSGDIERGERRAAAAQLSVAASAARAAVEQLELQRQRAVGGGSDAVSSSISALVVKRIAPAMVWRWMKVAL